MSTRLCDLPRGVAATVAHVNRRSGVDPLADRLRDLGFVEGEPVRVVALGPIGKDPILVQVGFTRFALRHREAERVMVDSHTQTA
jgi:ferrous iron transport protein A